MFYFYFAIINWWNRLKLDPEERRKLDENLLIVIKNWSKASAYSTGDDGRLVAVKRLICQGARCTARCVLGETALHIAACQADSDVMKFLVQCGGGDLNDQSYRATSPLHLFLRARYPARFQPGDKGDDWCTPVIRWMLRRGADPNARDFLGQTPLMVACGRPFPVLGRSSFQYSHESFRHLLDFSGLATLRQEIFGDPIEVLLAYGANRNLPDDKGRTVWHYMVHSSTWLDERAEILEGDAHARRHALKNTRDDKAWTPLHEACDFGNRPAVNWLLDNGANVKARGDQGETPLHVSSQLGWDYLIPDLIEHGSDVRARMDTGENCFHLACRYGHIRTMRAIVMMTGRYVVDQPVENGETCLHRQCSKADVAGVVMVEHLLLRCLADANALDDQGKSALDRALEYGNLGAVPFLVYKDARATATPGKKQLYAIYKKATNRFHDYLKEHAPAPLKAQPAQAWTTKMFVYASQYLVRTGVSLPEQVFAHLVAAVKLRKEFACRLKNGGDAKHDHFVKVLQSCRTILKPNVHMDHLVAVLEGQPVKLISHSKVISNTLFDQEGEDDMTSTSASLSNTFFDQEGEDDDEDYPLSEFIKDGADDHDFPSDFEDIDTTDFFTSALEG